MGFKPDLDGQLVSFSALTLLVWSLACNKSGQNDLLCVEWDVKPYTLTHSLCVILCLCVAAIALGCALAVVVLIVILVVYCCR